MKLKITIEAEMRGSTSDPREYAAELAKEVKRAMSEEGGPDVEVMAVQVERKLDGYELIGSA